MFSKRLKQTRKEAGFTQVDIANLLDVDRSTVAHYESEKYPSSPSTDILAKLSRILNVSTDYLLGITNTKKAPDVSNDIEGDEDLQEILEIMERLPKIGRKKAVRILQAACAEDEETSTAPDDAEEVQ